MSSPYQRLDISNCGAGRIHIAINCGVRSVKNGVFQHTSLGCYITLTITYPSRVTKLLPVEFSNTKLSVSLHPSRIIEHLMYFKNPHRGAKNIPLGCTDATQMVSQNNHMV